MAHKRKSISRRDLLIYSGVAIAAASLPLSYVLIQHKNADPTELLLASLSDPAAAAIVGRAWREARQQKEGAGGSKAEIIARTIAKRLAPYGWNPDNGEEGLKNALATRMRKDFESGDIVDIMGWQLSRTAAELCALAAAHHAIKPA